jgi:hypothetical protein
MGLDLPIGVVISTVVAFSGPYRYQSLSPVIGLFPAESTLRRRYQPDNTGIYRPIPG